MERRAGGAIAPTTQPGIERLRSNKLLRLEQQASKKQRTIASFFGGGGSSDVASSSTDVASSSNAAPVGRPKNKAVAKPAAPREAQPEASAKACERADKRTEDQILTYLLNVFGNMCHPLHPSVEGVQWWVDAAAPPVCADR